MGYSIRQLDADAWELRAADGTVLGTFNDGAGRTGYDLALLTLGQIISEEQLANVNGQSSGLLPEGWMSENGIAYSEKLAGGRDFTNCAWSWRDPQAGLVPLMFQTGSEMGHMGAELCGFFTELSQMGGTVMGRGRFYDSEMGVQARDTLAGGKRFGVSVDPSEKVDAEYNETCTSWDDEGFCNDGVMEMNFLSYEIAGATMTPFPGFENAQLVLDPNPGEARVVPVRASAPTGPPSRALLTRPEPPIDELVEQVDRAGNVLGMAYPLTITDPQEDGYRYAYAHLTYWSQCHIGDPWGAGRCASAQPSATAYAEFHAGETATDDGKIPTGRLVVGCEHSDAMDCAGVRDHLAHAGMGWASAHVVDGEFGPWMCAVLDPSLTDAQINLLRSLSLSGEWVGELGGILSVNASGLPVQRQRLAASGFSGGIIPQAAVRASVSGGIVTKLIGANVVGACPECEKRRLAASAPDPVLTAIANLTAAVTAIDLRTRHLAEPAAEDMIRRLAASAKNGQT